jgi:phosphate uptake regulator
MLEEAIEALVTGDRRLAEDAIKREDDADMMYWLILRLVLSAQVDEALVELLGMRSRLEIAGYRVICRDLETVADYCEVIARSVLALLDMKVEISPAFAKQLKELGEAVTEIYGKAIGGLLSREIKQANDAIRQQETIVKREHDLVRIMLKDYDDPKVIIPLRTIINGVIEMSEYANSIAVIAFNRYLEKPSNLSRPAPPQ